MNQNFDIIIIGTGTGGSYAARIAAKAGKKVAIVDDQPFGGTCALRGCNPKKSMVSQVELADWYNRMSKTVFKDSKKAVIDFKKLAKFKKTFVQNVTKYRESAYSDLGITQLHGQAEFINKNTIQIKNQTYSAKKFLIASGSTPRPLDFEGSNHMITSDEFLNLQELPKKLIFIGAGFISLEFAFIAAKAGSQVDIFVRNNRILTQFDEDMVKLINKSAEENGIQIHCNTDVMSIAQKGKKFIVKTNKAKDFEADLILNATGRIPKIAALHLENAGVDYSVKGIKTNTQMRTRSKNIYAAGDCTDSGFPQLAPVAKVQGEAAIHNILNFRKTKPNLDILPSVVFTQPRLATVGLTEAQAKAQKLNYKINTEHTGKWASNRYVGEEHSAYKIIIDKKSDLILGAHIVGYHADEVINVIALAMKTRMTATELKNTILAYPTMGSSMKDML